MVDTAIPCSASLSFAAPRRGGGAPGGLIAADWWSIPAAKRDPAWPRTAAETVGIRPAGGARNADRTCCHATCPDRTTRGNMPGDRQLLVHCPLDAAAPFASTAARAAYAKGSSRRGASFIHTSPNANVPMQLDLSPAPVHVAESC